jgi:hypothetical protein
MKRLPVLKSQWLYEQIKQDTQLNSKSWNPEFSLPSTLNWMQALAHEIISEHGETSVEQFLQCRSNFAKSVKPLERKTSLAPIFGSLFHALTFDVTLISMAEAQSCRPWTLPSAIVTWYYAVYNAFRCVVAASLGDNPPETHAGLQKSLFGSNIRPNLPHPFNMIATYEHNEDYNILLPCYPEIVSSKLEESFTRIRSQSQGMIFSYLKGTAAWEVESRKSQIKQELKIKDFRTKQAQHDRNEKLRKKLPEVNFLNCAFRYRGKANYRDSIFLTYGQNDSRIGDSFVEALGTVAQFAFLCGLAYAERRVGKKSTRDFLIDVSHHFRGQANASPNERFCDELLHSFSN